MPGACRPDRPARQRQAAARALLVAVDDRVGAHVGERLDRQRRIEPAHRREGRAADHEQVRDVPALAVLVDDRRLGIAAHARAALVVRAGLARAERRPPDLRCAHRAADLLHLLLHELDARELVRPPPVVGHARRRQAPGVAHVGIEIDGLVGVGQVLGLRDHGAVARVVLGEEVAIGRAPARHAGRRVHGHGGDRAAFEVGRADRDLRAADEAESSWSKLSALKSSIVCFCALGPM